MEYKVLSIMLIVNKSQYNYIKKIIKNSITNMVMVRDVGRYKEMIFFTCILKRRKTKKEFKLMNVNIENICKTITLFWQ